MSMTAVNIALTSTSAASNAAAQAAAHRARVDRCAVFESRFEVARASVAEKQEYASCVSVLYPSPVSEEGAVFIKVGIVILLVSMVAGLVYGYLQDRNVSGSILFGFLFPLGAAMAIFVIFLVAAGVTFLFS